jgi:hypothetical protein
MVPLEEEVPPEEEVVPALAVTVPQGPPIMVTLDEEEVPTPIVTVPPEGRGCLVSVDC